LGRTLLERKEFVGGACISETAMVDGAPQTYPLGATTLGLMQDFVWQETGLADRLQAYVPSHVNLAFFPGNEKPVRIHCLPLKLRRVRTAGASCE